MFRWSSFLPPPHRRRYSRPESLTQVGPASVRLRLPSLAVPDSQTGEVPSDGVPKKKALVKSGSVRHIKLDNKSALERIVLRELTDEDGNVLTMPSRPVRPGTERAGELFDDEWRYDARNIYISFMM